MTKQDLPQLSKPKQGLPCNGCGYCCNSEPCALAKEFLHCATGPCIALEVVEGRFVCGFVRNPLEYLFMVAHPDQRGSVLDAPPDMDEGHQLSVKIATALGLGQGCDAEDDIQSALWPLIFKSA
ncbi:hypothetical protein QAO71_16835 (plasmid) [Halopseudomonas sp. SMJS2]|uniref:hypothetical protein n=1 Tax=Halopseudomonas sp. SMJS2 TaxID=3041098 RepID=UPI00245337A8|nr:hypothetical protein [Halopseudomonas sp. SMJS2]WGK63437.1 hypothetical protein QAO71_16835 [Halopseudomonas sp. SMJS2]